MQVYFNRLHLGTWAVFLVGKHQLPSSKDIGHNQESGLLQRYTFYKLLFFDSCFEESVTAPLSPLHISRRSHFLEK